MRALAKNESLSDGEQRSHVVLRTVEGRRFAFPRAVACCSLLIAEMLEDAEAGDLVELPLQSVDQKCLLSIYDYMDHHQTDARPREIEKPLRSDLSTLVDPWDWTFVETNLLQGKGEKNNEHLFAVLNAANYLHIPGLRDLCGAMVAHMVRHKTEEEILNLFGVSEPFTKEQEEKLCKDFPWLADP
jgi:S-phase kinase-associated protein 1